MVETINMIPGLGVSVDEVREAVEQDNERTRGSSRDQRICICGHPVTRHKSVAGRVRCMPSRMRCLCEELVAVVEVSDTRVFLRRTTGVGPRHALAKGLAMTYEREGRIEWLVDVVCSRCGATNPLPAGLRKFKGEARVVDEMPQASRLLCASCIRGMR